MRTELSAAENETYLKYAKLPLPRHTSYPTANEWRDLTSTEIDSEINQKLREYSKPISLYAHIPFCRSLCFYCGCTRDVVPDEARNRQDPSNLFLSSCVREMQMFQDRFGKKKVETIHLGGGTPTFLTPMQLETFFKALHENFTLDGKTEIAIEVDPRVTTEDHFKVFRDFNVTRISIGVQDFDPTVQKAVNRIQSFEQVRRIVEYCQLNNIQSVNFDLIYGLPFQNQESLMATLAQVISLGPDRVSFFRLAVIPEMFKWQNAFSAESLPEGLDVLKLFLQGLKFFQDHDYEFIGLDHFAKKTDRLTRSYYERTLERNFQGMSTHRGLPIIGFGPSAISEFGNVFFQNAKDKHEWSEALQRQKFSWEKGFVLSDEDTKTQNLIKDLYCYGEVSDLSKLKKSRLEELQNQGLVEVKQGRLSLTEPLGRILVRVVASEFDPYFQRRFASSGRLRASTI